MIAARDYFVIVMPGVLEWITMVIALVVVWLATRERRRLRKAAEELVQILDKHKRGPS